MGVEAIDISALPNEILMKTLSLFRTQELLRITLTSHRFHNLIVRIIETRLIQAAALPEHTLILEVFHPSTKLSTPYLFCEYLGTGSPDEIYEKESLFSNPRDCGSLSRMTGLYSHFRPFRPFQTEEDRKTRRAHPAGGPSALPNALAEKQADYVSQKIHLESHELFTQLCIITNLVKVGPKRGLFRSSVNIGEGIMRVWREWLAERCASLSKRDRLGSGPNTKEDEDEEYKNRMVWTDPCNHIGLRMRVVEKEIVEHPLLVGKEEDEEVSYTLQFEELVIRTTQLLYQVEESLEQEANHSGKAIVISYANTAGG